MAIYGTFIKYFCYISCLNCGVTYAFKAREIEAVGEVFKERKLRRPSGCKFTIC